MAGALRELIAFFGVEVDDKPLDKSKQKMDSLADTARNVGKALGLAFGVKEIFSFVAGQVEAAATTAHTAEMLGMTVEQMERFNYAASTMGLSAEEADNSLRFLNRSIGEAATKGGDGAAAFTKLGVHLKDASGQVRPTGDVLGEVADGFTKLKSPAEKTAVAMQLFGRAGARMIPFLNQGSAGAAELNAEFDQLGGGTSKAFVAASLKTEHEMAKMRLVSMGLKSQLAGALVPAFTYLIEKVTSVVAWFREVNSHSLLLTTAMQAGGAVLAGVAVNWALLNSEMILSAAGFIIAIAVVEDLHVAMLGGKSVIGDWLDSIMGLGATQAVFEQLETWVQQAKIVFESFGTDLENLSIKADEMANSVSLAFGHMSASEYNAATARDTERQKASDAKYKALSEQYDKLGSGPSVYDKVNANENAFAQQLDPNGPNMSKGKYWDVSFHAGHGASVNPDGTLGVGGRMPATVSAPPGAAAAPVTNHVTQNANVTQTFNGAADAKVVGRAASDGTRKGFEETLADTFSAAPMGGGH